MPTRGVRCFCGRALRSRPRAGMPRAPGRRTTSATRPTARGPSSFAMRRLPTRGRRRHPPCAVGGGPGCPARGPARAAACGLHGRHRHVSNLSVRSAPVAGAGSYRDYGSVGGAAAGYGRRAGERGPASRSGAGRQGHRPLRPAAGPDRLDRHRRRPSGQRATALRASLLTQTYLTFSPAPGGLNVVANLPMVIRQSYRWPVRMRSTAGS